MATTYTYTARQVIAAMKRNGLTKAQGSYIRFAPGTKTPIAGCVYGQAAVNLNPRADVAFASRLRDKFDALIALAAKPSRATLISPVGLNDRSPKSIAQIAREVEAWFAARNVDLDNSRIQIEV